MAPIGLRFIRMRWLVLAASLAATSALAATYRAMARWAFR